MQSLITAMTSRHKRYFDLMFLLFFAVVTFALYAKTINGPFLFDDFHVVRDDPALHMQSITADNLQQIMSMPRPAALLTFAFNYYFHQHSVAGYHLVNIIIHIITGFFYFFLLKKTMALPFFKAGKKHLEIIPYLSTALWLIHPLHTQAVSYIVQRMTSMAVLFFTLALLLYVTARINKSGPIKIITFFGCAVSGVLAFLSKEIAVTLPIIIILYEWFFIQDLNRKFVKYISLLIIVCSALLALAYVLHPAFFHLDIIQQGYKDLLFTLPQRLMTQARVVIFYISLLLYPAPSRLTIDHDFLLSTSFFSPPSTFFSILTIGILLLLAIKLSRKERLISFCIFFYFINLIIESSFIPLDMVMEHRTYLPSLGFILLFTICLCKMARTRRNIIAIVIILFSLWGYWTYQRNLVWSDDLLFYQDNAAKAPGKMGPFYNVACAYSRRNNAADAVKWLQMAATKKDSRIMHYLDSDREFDPIRQTDKFVKFREQLIKKIALKRKMQN